MNTENKKVSLVIVSQRYGIVPDIYGGAVENIITQIIDQNEKHNRLDITIIASYDTEAKRSVKHYKNTKFVFLKESILGKIFYRLIGVKLQNARFWRGKIFSEYGYKVYKTLKKMTSADFIMIEEGKQIEGYSSLYRLCGGKLIYHSHLHEIPTSKPYYDYILTVSKFCSKPWLEYLPVENVRVLFNGINTNKFLCRISDEERESLRVKLGITKHDFVVLYCGRILPVKGVRELIKAVNEIDDINIKVLCVGSTGFANGKRTKYLDDVQKMVDSQKRVLFTGFVKQDELYRYYQVADVQAIPSLWEEAAGLVSIEGALSGLPLIITNSGGLVEYAPYARVVKRGSEKEIVEGLKREILFLKDNIIKREQLAKCGYNHAKHFSSLRLYETLCDIIYTWKM